jgi:hypothetical protein
MAGATGFMAENIDLPPASKDRFFKRKEKIIAVM